jgi:hypothetical protein
MAESTEDPPSGTPAQESGTSQPPERIPFMQQLLDNPFMLLFLGVVMPAVFYMIWGIMEISQIPIAD